MRRTEEDNEDDERKVGAANPATTTRRPVRHKEYARQRRRAECVHRSNHQHLIEVLSEVKGQEGGGAESVKGEGEM